MIDDPNPAPGGPAGERARRVARADTHVPTPRAAGGYTRTRAHQGEPRGRFRALMHSLLRRAR